MNNYSFDPRRVPSSNDPRASHTRSPFVIPQVSGYGDNFADAARGQYIFPAWQNQLRLPQNEFSRPYSPTIEAMTQYQSSSGASPANSPTIEAMTQYQSSSGASPAKKNPNRSPSSTDV
ncbi:hypothetical protein OS493_033659 [Desmophyllum pertusum]|uniref:Uncharacterized protein n=1 Tax=Desmophyllum pertusum TaxID=174260 RepID=A0A9X0CEI2_9CNID|nr:hypothetical protein OS493_033659 [Desmophyllum pertusum]